MAIGEIDDGQAAVRKTDSWLHVDTAVIRPAVKLTLIHTFEQGHIDAASLASIKYSGNSTHVLPSETW